jgi:hypothetical protein
MILKRRLNKGWQEPIPKSVSRESTKKTAQIGLLDPTQTPENSIASSAHI